MFLRKSPVSQYWGDQVKLNLIKLFERVEPDCAHLLLQWTASSCNQFVALKERDIRVTIASNSRLTFCG